MILGVDRVGCMGSYARVTPGVHAGTVRVVRNDPEPGKSAVTVTYDMSLIPGADGAA